MLPTKIRTRGGLFTLHYLIDCAVEHHKIDYVLFDFRPSASPLNINWITLCDMILPPSFADDFNCSSLHGLLTSVLPSVIECHEDCRRSQEMEEACKLHEMEEAGKLQNMLKDKKLQRTPYHGLIF